MVEGLHRYCKQGLVRVLDRRFHILVVAEGAVRDYDPLGVEGTLKARLELVQPALEKDLFSEHLLTVQVDFAVVDARWIGQPGPWLATLPDLRLQACFNYLDELDFLAYVVPRLLNRKSLRDLAVAVFKLAERAARTLAS